MKIVDIAAGSGGSNGTPLLICFSHLRWDFVFQRPQHLMTRLAQHYRVLFWEEPLFEAVERPMLRHQPTAHGGGETVTPLLPHGLSADAAEAACRTLLDDLVARTGQPDVRWYYTPMMLAFSRHLAAGCTVYDCMDELANFRFAPSQLLALEAELIAHADLVFTGGHSLYEAKRGRHPQVHAFPSSVDVDHFRGARTLAERAHGGPRLGFYGVVDERMDLDLLASLADARPGWTIEIVGPVVKIDPADLPRRANILYAGPRSYAELPTCLARWDVALMPFAINDSTRFISPTKTPEYLAAGRPVVSTPIADVVRHYGAIEGVRIADGADAFVAAVEQALALPKGGGAWLVEVDALLATGSWDRTAAAMLRLVRQHRRTNAPTLAYSAPDLPGDSVGMTGTTVAA